MAGIPGSGKSYFAQHYLMKGNTWAYISRDVIRFSIITNEDEYFSKEDHVFNTFIENINDCLLDNVHTNIIADATHINWASRKKLLNHLHLDNVKVNIVWMQTDYLTCVARNTEREGRARVSPNVLWDMYNRYVHPYEDKYKYNAIYDAYADGEMYKHGKVQI